MDGAISDGSVASWLFIGAAAVLGALLAFLAARQRQT
jgi:hypothetical protein